MNCFKRRLVCLFITVFMLSCQMALADAELSPSEFYFTQEQDLVVYDDSSMTIALKGDQPTRTYSDGYDLGFWIENHLDWTIEVTIFASANDNIMLQAFKDQSARTVIVPANETGDFTIHVIPSLIKEYNEDIPITMNELSEINNFEGLHALDITVDARHINDPGNTISVSYWAMIYFDESAI